MSNDGVISIVGNQNASVIDGNSSVIVAGNGNDSLTAGAGSIVTAGNGADTISVGAGSVVVAGSGNDTVTAGSNSLVTAGNGSDHVTAGANSVIVVGNGNDTLSVGNNSIVTAGNGNDQVTVGANSVIVVGNGNDTLTAGANSVITAGNGNDTIHLGQNDLVVVGTGKDTFVLPSSAQLAQTAPTSLSVNEDGTVALALGIASSGFGFGKETIVGFNTSKDVIQLSTAQFANFAAVMASAKQIGNDTIITGDASDTIDLSGVRLSSLTASDFSFVSSTSNISVTISGIPAGVTLSDTAGAITVVNGSATLTQAQLAGLTLKAGEVTAGTLTVTATDTSTGNFVTKTIALTVNPVAPTLGGPTSLTVGSGTTIALGITETPFDSRDTISLTIKGVPSDALLSAGTKNVDGSWTLTPAQLTGLTLKAGGATSASLTVTATNTAGIKASVTETIQLNVTTPLKVTFDTVSFTDTGVQGDHITNNGNVTLSGTVTDNLTVSQVQVFNGNTLLGSATVDNVHHRWSLVTPLVNGTYNQLNVQATDSAGTSVSASTTQYFQVDTTAPMLVSDSESVSGLTQSKVESITILASDANGVASVAIYDDVTHKLLGNATLNGGAWKYSATDLSDGVHKFYAVITDVAGNQTTTADLTTVTVDTTPPTLISDSESAPGLTKSNVETITVNATDANGVASVTIYEEGTAQPLGAATLSSGTPSRGTWSFSTGSLGDGAHNFYAVIVDTAGNQTKTADLATVTVDTTPPALISDSESVSGLTQSTTDVITVSASDINGVASVAIYEEGKAQPLGSATLSAGSAGNGTWTYNATGLGDGAHTYYAVITDAAGNQTKTTDLATVTVDTTAPMATIAISASGATNTTTETITVNASDADGVASVEIDDNGAFLANATQGSPGVWTYTAANLTEGGHDFTAVVKDAATNSTTTGHATVVVDTTAPSVTFDTVSYDHTGTAGFTKDGTVTLSGTTSDNVTVSQVQVFSGAQLLGDATVDNTSHTWTLTQNLPAGVYSNLSVTATDEAGNTGTAANSDATQTFQVDHTPPSIAFGTVSYVDTGVANDGITGNNLVTMSGAVADDVTVSQVQVFSGSQLLGNAVIDNTSHSWTLTSNLADGTYANLSATATDEAGNSTSAANTSATTSFQIDTAAPIITFTSVTLAHPTDSSGTNSSDGGIILSGAVSDNVSVTQVQVFNGSQLLGPATVSNGTWALATTLAQGSYNNLHATATDEAGNVADAGNSHVVTVSPASGYVIDGYITGATVFADTNGNGKLDAGEASGITDESGHFTLGAGTTTGTLVLVGGTDTATGLAFTGVMTAPTGSTQVTPLTTLVQSVAAAKGGDVAAASQSVAKALGLDPTVNLTNLDTVAAAYAGDSSAFVAASKVLNTVSMVASAVAGTGASDFSSAASSAFSALAAQIATTSAPLDLSSTDLVSTVVSSTIASASSGTSSLTSDQTAAIASVVTSVNVATDKAAAANSGTGTTATAALLTSVSATSIVAQGTTSTQLQQATSGVTDLTTLANNTTAASVTSDASQQHVGSVAPAAPTFVSLTPTDGSPNNFTMVHYTLTFSDPVTGVSASDFSIATTGLVGASIAGITPVAGSNGTQYTISVNTGVGVGDGTLTLSFTGSAVQDIAGNAFKDQSTHTGATYIVDQDTGEQAALGLNVTNTNVNTAGSAIFSFTVAGLEPNDTGTVTFTDGANKVSVAVSGGQTSYTANLGTLTDGPITSSLAVNTDAAGNSFTPVAGTSAVTLSGFNVAGSPIQVIQNGAGDITVIPSGSVTTQSGNGVTAEESASGTGNVTVNATGSVTGQGTGSIGLLAENLNAANTGNIAVTATGGVSGAFDGIDVVNKGNGSISVEAGGAVAATVQFGIRTEQYGSGSTSVVTDAGNTINSGGAGISLVNFATSIGTGANSVINVTNNATINSGTTLNPSGSQPQGIAAGYYGTTGGPGTVGIANTSVNGTVTVNNNGNITAAAGYGINAYNYGNGNVTVNEAAGTSVSGAQYGIGAFGNSKGTGSVAVNVGANATISGGSIFGIQAFVNGVGSVSVTTSAGDYITGGSSGINAQSQSGTDDATSSVSVIAHGTIHSGTLLTPNGSTPGGIVAGYSPNGSNSANGAVAGNVLVQSDATIVAAAGSGINAYNYGAGNVTVTTGATSSITGATSGNQANGINANALDGGNVSVTNGGFLTGGTGIFSSTNHGGSITIENDGQITATANSGINAQQASAGATGSVTIINTGTVVGAANRSAINVAENAAGTVTITNSGTIGSAATAGSTPAITETGGSTVTINNNGQIDGNVYTNSTGGFTGTFNNNAGATWLTGFLDDEGSITASGADSTIVLVGTSIGMTVGNSGTGNLTVAADAALTASFLNIANLAGSHGTVTVTGPGSTLNTTSGQFQNITVGNDGTASLTVSNQAVVTTTNMGVAYNFDADVTDTLTVDNATLNSTQGLTIANSGTANATVKNGGTITTGFLSLSNNAGSAGSLTVDGAGSVVTAQSMSLGSGSTTVTITNGGAVDIGPGTSTIAGALHIGSATSLGGAGKINGNVVDDGNLTAVGLLNITGILGGSGTININDGGTLELAGSGAENVFFTGGNGTLMLDNALGFTGTIAGSSGNSGNFTIAGQGNVTTAAGDAIDFTSGGGAVGSQANVIVTTSGTISGAVNGINAVQNGVGDVTVDPGASVTGRAGDGLIAEQSTTGTGNVTVNATGSVTGQGAGTMGLLAENLNAANAGNINVTSTGGASGAFDGIDVVNKGNGNISVEAGGAVAATVQFGIRTEQYGSGSTSVVMDPGSTIHSGGAGIAVIDYATSLLATANSTITVTNNSTINSGTTLNPSGSQPQGIAAGYYGNNGTANTAINGTVTINNNGNVTAAAGYGLDGYNYGNGNVTVNDGANTSVSGAQYGIGAFNNSKGSGSVAVNVGANSTVSGGSIFGIQAFVNGVGRVSVTTSAGDQITGGSSGINAQSQSGTDDATSSVTVIAHGTIHSGTLLTPNGSTPGGIVAGYSPNGSNSANGAVAGNVLVQSDATIVAAAGSGINAYNYGAGNVTVTTGAISSITGASSGAQANGINANTFAGGNISVTNGGFLTGGTGIFTGAALGGSITVENDGQITATANSGINVQQASASATGSVSITNTGTIVGAANKSAINVSENPFGTVTINNSGTIGLATATSTAALTENGGAAVIVNNNGQIYGNLYTNSTGGFTGAFNNNAGATLQASFIDDEGSVTASGAFSVVSVGGMGLGNTNSTASLNVNNGGAIVIGTGTSTIANAIHIGSSAGIGGAGVINGNVVNDGNIAANGLLHITGALSGSGMLNINNGGTLELAGSGAENFFFGGGNDTLKLDNAPGFTGTIAGSAANSGNFTITGQGSVTTSAGDGIDFTSAAGAVGSQANVIVTPGGAISGAVNGINVVQNGVGDIVVSPSGSVTGQAGNGVIAEQNITGIGSITVNATGSVTGQGTGSIGVFAENLDAANTGNINVTATGSVSGGLDGIYVVNHGSGNDSIEAGAVSATVQFGIRDESYGTGSMTTLTDAGNTINSGGAGISLVSFATSIGTGANSVITVTNNATINSGTTLNPSGSQPQGIAAGYYGTTGGPGTVGIANSNVNGTVTVNNNGNVTAAAGYGINAYNYGNGNVTVNEAAGTSVSGAQYGIGAFGNSKGTGSVAVNVGANATISGGSIFGIQAFVNGVGSVSVTTSAGDYITGGSSGINAQSQSGTDDATSSVSVIAHGTIHSGTLLTPNGSTPGGIVAGYSPNGSNSANGAVAGNVLVQSDATIVAAAGSGINAYNYGAGNVTVTTGATSSITGATSGNQANGINANALDGGNVSVTNGGFLTGGTGIFSSTNHGGSITIENDGQITATANSGINAQQASAGATGSVTIINTGTVVGAANRSAINVAENAAGTVTITNSGTIGSVATAGSTPAITETGGSTVTINNNGQIDGNVYTNSTGGFTGTFNNNAGATWLTGFLDDEGTITASGASSAITAASTSIGMAVGNTATGNMTIAAGAALTSTLLNIAVAAGSHGTVTITGAGTTANFTSGTNQDISVGVDGTASLTIADHAVVNATHMGVGVHFDAGVTDTLDINAASLTTYNLTVGDAGAAIATVENGGTLTSNFIELANQAGSTGSLTVDGAGSVVTTQGLGLGSSSSSATLTVTHGGAIDIGPGATTVAGAVHVGSSASLSGAGTINANLVDDGNVTVTAGTLHINGAVTGTGSVVIDTGAQLEFGSTVASTTNLTFQGSTGSVIIDHGAGFAGLINGFTGDGTLAGSDQIDVKDINYNSGSFTESFDAASNTLTLSDGASTATLHFNGTYVAQNFSFTTDGGTGVIVYDPPVTPNTSTPGSDGFQFANVEHTSIAGIQWQDLLHFHGDPSGAGSSPHAPGAGAGMGEAHVEHDLAHIATTPNADVNWNHYHLV